MIIFRESGRLGNQLFQYAALKTLCQKEETLLLLGFNDLQKTFNGIDAKIINSHSPRIERAIYYRSYNYLDILSQTNVFTRIQECNDSSKSPKLIYNSPLFNNLKFVGESYFQSESNFDERAISRLQINSELLNFARSLISEIAYSNTPIFVHVRRGDYLTWPNANKPAVLEKNYYHNCIDVIKSKIPNPFFIFISDDPFYVKDVFGDMRNSFISTFSLHKDFAIMTQCLGGILSASSFSWWGAYFSHLQNSDSTFLAPKYWSGHRSGSWYPPFIECKFLQYIDV
jgi:Glycosyl transferase family 11